MLLIQHLSGLIRSPHAAWERIEADPASIPALYARLVLLPAALPTVMFWLLDVLEQPYRRLRPVPVATYVVALLDVLVAASLIVVITRMLQGRPSLRQAFKVVAYAAIPYWIAVAMFPWSFWLSAALCGYALYQMGLGLPRLMKTPDQATPALRILATLALPAAFLASMLVLALVGQITAPPVRYAPHWS